MSSFDGEVLTDCRVRESIDEMKLSPAMPVGCDAAHLSTEAGSAGNGFN
jgi:hypothetical protein